MSDRIRFYYRRQATRLFGRMLQALFTRTRVTGAENIPARGPYIAIGNHVAAIEVALMVLNLPQAPELIGNGDVPLDPTFAFMARWYGFIPIRRGHVDRAALRQAQAVLEAGHVLGVFPEGGIWDRSGAARPGVAWLSQQTGAPILPVGFGGIRGALAKATRLARPRLTMNIGPLMPPVPNPESPAERRAAVEAASVEMMRRIFELVPAAERQTDQPVEEHYAFEVEVTTPDDAAVPLPEGLTIPHSEDLAFYFHRYLLLEVVWRNYRLTGAKPLSSYAELYDPAQLGPALDVALDFYAREPAFLGYRVGYARAARILAGLGAVRELLAWAETREYQVRLLPKRTIMNGGGEAYTVIAPSVRPEY